MRRGIGSHVKQRQPLVTKRRDGIAQQGDGKEDQEDLPVGALENTVALGILEDIDTRDEEQCSSEVHGQGDCDLADEEQPATDPACNTAPLGGGEHESLVVDTCTHDMINTITFNDVPREVEGIPDRQGEAVQNKAGQWSCTSSSGIDTGDFTERRSDADNDERDGDPSPDNIDGTTANNWETKTSSETVGNRREDEGHEGDLESRTITRQLGLVAQVLEEIIGGDVVASGAVTLASFGFGLHHAVGAAGAVVHDVRHD